MTEKIIRPEEFGKTLPLTSIICEGINSEDKTKRERIYGYNLEKFRDRIANECDSEGRYKTKINFGEQDWDCEGQVKTLVYSILESRHSDYYHYCYDETEKVELTFEEFQRLGRPMQLRRETVHTYTAVKQDK